MYGPPPSRLVFLADLPRLPVREKVRFLGCVETYHVSSATLVLKHAHPPTANPVLALVNVEHVLESVKGTDLQTGAWVNVIGYVGASPAALVNTSNASRADISGAEVHVQAIVLWSAGDVKLDSYERAVKARKAADVLIGPSFP